MSENPKKKAAEEIISKATAAAPSSSMLLTFLGDTAGLSAISVSMARHIAQICGKEITVEEALEVINTLAPNSVGRIAARTMLGFLPGIGNPSNAAISHGYFERLGWALFDYFRAN